MRHLIAPGEIEFISVCAQGPGGQNVNKVSNAIHLRFDIGASSLPDGIKARLLTLQDQRISKEGVLVIKAQSHRSRELNKADALQRLEALVAAASVVPAIRRPTRRTWGSQQRRLSQKSQRAEVKSSRGKVSW